MTFFLNLIMDSKLELSPLFCFHLDCNENLATSKLNNCGLPITHTHAGCHVPNGQPHCNRDNWDVQSTTINTTSAVLYRTHNTTKVVFIFTIESIVCIRKTFPLVLFTEKRYPKLCTNNTFKHIPQIFWLIYIARIRWQKIE